MSIEGLTAALTAQNNAERALQEAELSLLTTKTKIEKMIRALADDMPKKPTEAAIANQVMLHDDVNAAEKNVITQRHAYKSTAIDVEVAREHVRLERLALQREIAMLGAHVPQEG
jgi:hypothetical protein